MKSKKASQAKKEIKKTTPVAAKKTVKPTKPTKTIAPEKKVAVVHKVNIHSAKPIKSSDKEVQVPEIFKDFYREWDRIFLRTPRKFAGFPDLLDLQKKGY